MPRRSPAPGLLPVAAATLLLAALVSPGALLRGEAFFERDLHLDWYPRTAALGRALASGSWPLWEPGLGFGQPLLADPSAQALYPVTWLALTLPWGTAYTAYVVLHLVLAGLGAARLAARLGAGRPGAWAAGLAFVLAGPVQSAINLWHHFAGTAWLPWVLLAADAALRRPSVSSAVALAAAFALQVLAGSADLCAMTLALVALLAIARLARRARRRRARPALATTAVALALGTAVSCGMWWPAAEAVSRSARRGLPEDVRTAWSLPAAGLARLVAPLDPARVPFDAELWTRLYERPVPPLLSSLYLGLPLLGLVALALVARARRGRAWTVAGVGLLAVAFAMGPHGPLYGPLAELVPVLRIFRYPSKALLAGALAAALLAGLGVRALVAGAVSRRERLTLAAVLLACSLAGGVACQRLGVAPGWSPPLGVAAAVLLTLGGSRRPRRLACGGLVALALADLVAVHRDLNPTVPATVLLERPPVLAALQVRDGARIHVWDYHTIPGTSERLLGRRDPYRPAASQPGLDPRVLGFAAQRQLLVPPTATFFGLETSYDLDNRGLYPRDLNDLTWFLRHVEGTPLHTRLLQLGAVAKVLALHEAGLEALQLERALPGLVGDPLRIYSVPEPQPRAWLVGSTRVADGESALRALADPAFDPAALALVATGAALHGPGPLASGVTWLERRADRQRLETTSPRPALLVTADAFDPGWHASVDGRRVDLVRANIAFRGVPVPAGRHVVELSYRPRAVWLGLSVSLAGLAVTAGLAAVAGRRRRGAR
jgi:hypothetical protein